jgi:Fe-S oxidoreductase
MDLFLVLRIIGLAAAAVAVLYCIVSVSRRMRAERGGREEGASVLRLSAADAEAQARSVHTREAASSIAHLLTVIGLIAGVAGHAFSPLREAPGALGGIGAALEAVGFLGGASALIIGSLMSMARRIAGKNARFTHSAADMMPLLSQVLVGASGVFYWYAAGSGSGALSAASGMFHDFSMAFFVVCFCRTKLYHALGWLRLKRAGIPKLTGILPRDPGVEALRASGAPDSVRIGFSGLEDLTRLQRTEASACTSCGLCDAACPAAQTGKGLSPKRLTLAQSDLVKGGAAGARGLSTALMDAVGACTDCYACETACTFAIRKVDRITGIRRHAVLEKGIMSAQHRGALRNIERTGNLLGMDAGDRIRLLADAGIPFLGGSRPDYVLWLGCQAAYDLRMRSAVRAVAELLRSSGKTMAALETEGCCGDFARRIGEENLFLDMVQANAEVFSRLQGIPILTVCPHCAVSLGREYPELGVNVKAVHYTEILGDLSPERAPAARTAAPAGLPEDRRPLRVAYHDSCYIARVLGIVDGPRRFVERALPGVEIVSLENEGMETLCCGGGGGRIFSEEKPAERISVRTIDECAAKKADVLLVSCPTCLAMYADAASFRASGVRVMDLMELALLGRATPVATAVGAP